MTRKSVYRLLIKRITLASFAQLCLFSFFYVVGNFQLFLDESQTMLLAGMGFTGFITLGLAIVGLVVLVLSPRLESRPRRVLGISGYALCLLACCVAILVSYFFQAFAMGPR